MNLKKFFREWYWTALSVLFPPGCAGCGIPGTSWCRVCQAKIKRIAEPLCSSCGAHLPGGKPCSDCVVEILSLRGVRCLAYYEGVFQKVILHLKYQGDRSLAAFLSTQLVEVIERAGWQFEMVLPVPLGPQKLKSRGYNQAALLASEIARSFHQPQNDHILIRNQDTRSQVGLEPEERFRNVAEVFTAQPAVRGKTILVIDDVFTTGATLEACAQALYAAGANAVFGAALARAATPSITLPDGKIL
jgi:ComF family protein